MHAKTHSILICVRYPVFTPSSHSLLLSCYTLLYRPVDVPHDCRYIKVIEKDAMAQSGRTTRSAFGKDAVLSRHQIEAMIADGRMITIVDGNVLKLDTWLKYHPGGEKAIMHMVGRDATDEVNA